MKSLKKILLGILTVVVMGLAIMGRNAEGGIYSMDRNQNKVVKDSLKLRKLEDSKANSCACFRAFDVK